MADAVVPDLIDLNMKRALAGLVMCLYFRIFIFWNLQSSRHDPTSAWNGTDNVPFSDQGQLHTSPALHTMEYVHVNAAAGFVAFPILQQRVGEPTILSGCFVFLMKIIMVQRMLQ